jgi:hypothetical protein
MLGKDVCKGGTLEEWLALGVDVLGVRVCLPVGSFSCCITHFRVALPVGSFLCCNTDFHVALLIFVLHLLIFVLRSLWAHFRVA